MCTQGLFIAILQAAGTVSTVEDGKNLQNMLICLEMLPAALGMLVAFPYTEYKGSGEHTALCVSAASLLLQRGQRRTKLGSLVMMRVILPWKSSADRSQSSQSCSHCVHRDVLEALAI